MLAEDAGVHWLAPDYVGEVYVQEGTAQEKQESTAFSYVVIAMHRSCYIES
jgi:hypothetical protein